MKLKEIRVNKPFFTRHSVFIVRELYLQEYDAERKELKHIEPFTWNIPKAKSHDISIKIVYERINIETGESNLSETAVYTWNERYMNDWTFHTNWETLPVYGNELRLFKLIFHF
jgi:hypothetical protein